MLQFLIGFWCGFAAATLVLNLLHANRKKKTSDDKGKLEKESVPGNAEEDASGLKILLVDDSKLSRTVIKGFLAHRNVEIIEAESGTEGLRLARKTAFDLIFLDQHMPGLDGDETLRLLQQDNPAGPDVPVVAVSSTLRNENENDILARGYVAYLGKPIQKNRLDEIVEQVFGVENEYEPPKGFSYQKGLDNFDGNEEVYRETLVLFSELWTERKEQLRQFLEEDNMPEYAILIHAIKGDARTLGAEDLGELAYEQELQAKAGNTDAIRDGFDRVMKNGDETAEYFLKSFSEQVTGGE